MSPASGRPEKAVPLFFYAAPARETAVPLVFGPTRWRGNSEQPDSTNSSNAAAKLLLPLHFARPYEINNLR
jgi:hypothetical protein